MRKQKVIVLGRMSSLPATLSLPFVSAASVLETTEDELVLDRRLDVGALTNSVCNMDAHQERFRPSSEVTNFSGELVFRRQNTGNI